jgi:uncharacterized protein DUF6644
LRSSLLPFFRWCDDTFIAVAVRKSVIAFPAIETFHLLALTLLFGSIAMQNLRLCGFIMKEYPVSKVTKIFAPWTFWALVVMLSSGLILFLSEAMKCYGSDPFWIKMGFLFLTLAFHYTIYRRITQDQRPTVSKARLAAVVSFALWLGVGLAGRAIAFI